MIKLYDNGVYLLNGTEIVEDTGSVSVPVSKDEAAQNTMAYGILKEHNTSSDMEHLQIKFDKLTSHDITFVGIIQTARASGLEKFPIPYVLTNCHNSLCAVGGTINEDDHMFGLTCAKKYGGVYVPPHQAVIHQYAREMLAGGGKMILGDVYKRQVLVRTNGRRGSLTLSHKGLALDIGKSRASFQGRDVELTKNELGILKTLMEHKGTIVSREELIRELWEMEEFVEDSTLNVNINRLRKKLSDIGVSEYLMTKRGQGYMI